MIWSDPEGYAEYDERVMQLKVDDIKLKYRNMLSWKEKRCMAEEMIRKNSIEVEAQIKTIKELSTEIDALDRYYMEAKAALRELNVSKAIDNSRQQITAFEKQLEKRKSEREELEQFRKRLLHVAEELNKMECEVSHFETLGKLTAVDLSNSEKQEAIDALRAEIRKNVTALCETGLIWTVSSKKCSWNAVNRARSLKTVTATKRIIRMCRNRRS